ncbi:hypothetical protein JW865_09400 [Candidatus Bathyarchaeota archaeon]|nr:hypothetical protein [Candidatus Bathyarchaeota archaeon]
MEKETISFSGKKMNSDDSLDVMPMGDGNRLDVVYPNGDYSILENTRILTTYSTSLPPGENVVIGKCPDKENNAIIYFIANGSGNDVIRRFYTDNSFQDLSYAKDWGFDKNSYIKKAFIIGHGDESMLFFIDGLNESRLVNIKSLIDGDYADMYSADINLIKHAPIYKPTLDSFHETDTGIKNEIFQFAYKNVFSNGQKSVASHWSDVVYDYGNEFITSTINEGIFSRIRLSIQVDIDVKQVEVYVRKADIGGGVSGSWMFYDKIDAVYGSNYYDFKNDRQGYVVDQQDFISLEDYVPIKSDSAELIDNRIILGNNNVGFDDPDVDVSITLGLKDNDPADSVYYTTQVFNPYGTLSGINVKGALGKGIISYQLVIVKALDDEIVGRESYVFNYETTASSSGYVSNSAIIDEFVRQINLQTNFTSGGSKIVASSVSGGYPNLLRIVNNGGSSEYFYAYCISSPVLDKNTSLKINSSLNVAMRYYYPEGRCGNVVAPTTINVLPGYLPEKGWSLLYNISSLPPDGAVAYQFMLGNQSILSHFSIPIYTEIGYSDTDIEVIGNYFHLDIDKAINRYYDLNPSTNINNFTLQKGDRVFINARVSDTYMTDIVNNPPYDFEIYGITDDSKIILPYISPDSQFNISELKICMFEFYRPSKNYDNEDLVYYEIGDVLPIVGGYHQATARSAVTAVNQDATHNAYGEINFYNVYRIDQLVGDYMTEGTVFNAANRVKPIIARIESKSSSLLYDSKFIPTGRYGVISTNTINRTERTLIYGGKYVYGDLNYNEINRFANQPTYLSDENGDVIGLELRGYTLYAFQQNKINSIQLNRVSIQLSDGSTQAVYSGNLLGDITQLPQSVGCSDSMSIHKDIYNIYFYDRKTSSVYRLGQDGLNNISSVSKMKSYFETFSKSVLLNERNSVNFNIIGSFDPVKSMYLLTYSGVFPPTFQTVGYHEPTNSWLSYYTNAPEMYGSINNNRFFSFISGAIKEHHINPTRVSTGYVEFTFNKYPSNVKIFRNIEINAEQAWIPSEEGDVLIDKDSKAYQQPSYEWIYGKMSSLLKLGHFKNYEGRWIARFLRNMLNKKGVSQGKVGLVNGGILKGNTATIKLRNANTDYSSLKTVTIGYEISK